MKKTSKQAYFQAKELLNDHGFNFSEDNVYYANWEPEYIHSFIVDNYGTGKK